ncbi:MAG: hydroxymethylglutaryl-CoA reductase, partial [Verrucomicrobia bacterium]|nr:hydroxymethylglutaryl-CoA reductase [Verrucomicrobiota bacterium]
MKSIEPDSIAGIPMKSVGPIRLMGPEIDASVMVPLATLESPLWPSVNRGAKVAAACGGIQAVVVDDCMTRSIVIEGPGAARAVEASRAIQLRLDEIAAIVNNTTRYGRLTGLQPQVVGRLLYLRLAMQTGDAAGHNMVTQAADALMNWLLTQLPDFRYVSISGNICTDK